MSFFPLRKRERSEIPAHGPLANRDFLLLLAATVGVFTNYAPLLSVVPLWAAAGGSDHSGVGTTTAVTMATTVGIQVWMSHLLRWWGPYRLFLAGALMLGVPTFGYPLSTDLEWILAVCAVRGLGFGIVTVVGSALVAELTAPNQRGRAVGWHGVAIGIPQLGFLPLGVWAAETLGFLVVFLATGLSSSLAAFLISGITRRGIGHGGPSAPNRSRSRRIQLRPFAAPCLVMLVSACALGGATSFLPLAVTDTAIASVALFALSAAMTAGRWCAGTWSDRHGAGHLLAPGAVLSAAGMGGLAVAVAGLPVLAIAAMALYGFGFGVVQNDAMVVMFHRAGPQHHGTASTAWNVSFDAGTGAGSISAGLIAQAVSIPGAYWAAAFLIAAAAPVVWSDARRHPSSVPAS